MAEDKTNERNPQEDDPPPREPILFNWLITISGLAGIILATTWLTR